MVQLHSSFLNSSEKSNFLFPRVTTDDSSPLISLFLSISSLDGFINTFFSDSSFFSSLPLPILDCVLLSSLLISFDFEDSSFLLSLFSTIFDGNCLIFESSSILLSSLLISFGFEDSFFLSSLLPTIFDGNCSIFESSSISSLLSSLLALFGFEDSSFLLSLFSTIFEDDCSIFESSSISSFLSFLSSLFEIKD
eukprot:jgi/Orpsp1_1/1177504/evm.model.c7180000061685.1